MIGKTALVLMLMLLSASILDIGMRPTAAQPPYIRLSYTPTETRWAMVATNERYDPNYIVVAFTDNLTGQFDWYFTKSMDGGATWTTPEIAVNPDFDVMESELYDAAIAMDDNGIVHMSFARQKTWWPRDTAPTGIYYAGYDGTNWSAPFAIYENLSPDYLCVGPNDITIGRNNTIHLVYGSDYPGNDNGDIWYSRSQDGGYTWTSPMNINEFDFMDVGYPPSLTADDSGYVYYGCGDDWWSYDWWSELYFRRSPNDGVTWDPQMAISRREDGDRFPRLMCDNTGDVYVVWIGSPPDSLFFKYSTDHGSNWTPYYGGIALTDSVPGIGDGYFAELDDYGFIHIVYQSTATGTTETYYMRIDTSGNIVNPPQIITPDDGYPSVPTGLTLAGDQVRVVTKDAKDGNWEAYFLLPERAQVHDVAIKTVGTDKTIVPQGEGVIVNVTAVDHGDYPETFNVTAYADGTMIGRQTVSLNAHESQILTFEWNTTDFAIGDYAISAVADAVTNETDTADNTYNDGVVKVRWHDVAVVGVVPSATTIPFGNPVSVNVIVENQGAFAETFNATVFANSAKVQTKTVTNLEALASKVLTFEWNTAGFPIGTYTLEATADPVLGESDTADNTFVDGTVTVLLGIHNVAVTGITSDLFIPTASSSKIEVLVENKGTFSETFNVTVYANSSGIQTITVTDMMLQTTQTLDFTWNTAGFALGDYRITATATPVPNEAQVWDNTYIFEMVTIVNQTFLYVYPHIVVVRPSQTFTVDIRICNTIPNLWIWQICLYFDPTILTYISGGNAHGADYVMAYGEWHLQSTLRRLTFEAKIEGTSYLNFSRPIPDDTFLLDTGQNVYGCEVLDGTVQVRYGDVSVNNVILSKTVLCQGYSAPINCTIENKEEFQECFNALAYAESNQIDGAQVTMNGRCNMSLPLLWNSTGFSKGNYTVSAIAVPLLHETNTSDNYMSGGWIIVSMVGDITGPSGYPDGKVDARDVARICSLFGAKSSDPPYDPNWDITGPTGVPDGKIDARDVSLVSSRYGQKDP